MCSSFVWRCQKERLAILYHLWMREEKSVRRRPQPWAFAAFREHLNYLAQRRNALRRGSTVAAEFNEKLVSILLIITIQRKVMKSNTW
jgi:hypothetical protein